MSHYVSLTDMSPLQKAVVAQLGYSLGDELSEECLSELSDIANHSADAGWSGFIYYSDTVPFFTAHKKEILALLGALADDLGESKIALVRGFHCLTDNRKGKRIPLYDEDTIGAVLFGAYDDDNDDHTTIANALTWFALEEVARQLADER